MLQLVLACLCAPLAGPTNPPGDGQSETVIAFVNVTVIPMDRERRIPGQTVLVRGDRIIEIGPVARVKVPDGGVDWPAKSAPQQAIVPSVLIS